MMRILVADDDSDDAQLLREAVHEVSPETLFEAVSDGSKVLTKLENASEPIPGVIILDINMPNVNGWTTLKAIRMNERFSSVPVYIYSTSSHDRDKAIATELGATAFITKPERFEEIKAFVSSVLAHGK